jgi:hypothetical protein
MICTAPIQQNGPPMTMGPYNPPPNARPPHVLHHSPHPLQHSGGPPPPNHMQPPHGRHTPYFGQPDYRVYEMNKRLQQRTDLFVNQESDNLWWDAFATEFFEDDATLTLTFCLEDGPKRYSNLFFLRQFCFQLKDSKIV